MAVMAQLSESAGNDAAADGQSWAFYARHVAHPARLLGRFSASSTSAKAWVVLFAILTNEITRA
jgi:hypothetical protein